MVQYCFNVKQRQHVAHCCVPWKRVVGVIVLWVNFGDMYLFLFPVHQARELVFIPVSASNPEWPPKVRQ